MAQAHEKNLNENVEFHFILIEKWTAKMADVKSVMKVILLFSRLA